MKLPYKLLTYDIETGLLLAYLFSIQGEQRISYKQLHPAANITPIICIAYKWFHEKKTHILVGETAVEDFDKQARQADVCLGKNNRKFDIKHINTQRMLQGLRPYPEWINQSDDLESQLRKYFAFPSQSLDYISNLLGFGGKVHMGLEDWQNIADYKLFSRIVLQTQELSTYNKSTIATSLFNKTSKQVKEDGEKALKKMIFYNKKDVQDTENILRRVVPYITLKHNAATAQDGKGCIACGSHDLAPTKIVFQGKTKYQQFECLTHGGYGGKCTWYYKKGSHSKTFGKMGA